MKIRIKNIEFRKYKSSKKKYPLYEIVKWSPNSFYNKEQEYRDNGYVDSFGDSFLQKDNASISKTYFINPESCYVIAFIEKNNDMWCFRSVGERLLDLTPEEWNDLNQVYKLGQYKLNKKK